MKVYTVTYKFRQYTDMVGVYSSEAKAQEVMDECRQDASDKDEWEVRYEMNTYTVVD